MTREFLVVLRILTDDPDDDARRWPYDDLLAPPADCPPRHVKYVTGSEIKRP
jgi:hypothetical protein